MAADQVQSEQACSLGAFWPHFNQKRVRLDKANLGLALAMYAVSIFRQPTSHLATWGTLAFALTYGSALVACLLWAWAHPAHFASWREIPAALLPFSAFLAPSTWVASRKAIADPSLWDKGPLQGLLSFWAALGFATMTPLLLCAGLVWPKRFGLHAVAQAAYVAVMLRRVPDICAMPLLTHPASQDQLGQVYGALRVALAATVGPSPAHHSGTTAFQCQVSISLLMVLVGLVLPLACSAAWQSAEYRRWHEQWEQRAGPRDKPWWALSELRPASVEGQVALWLLLPTAALLLLDACILLLAQAPA